MTSTCLICNAVDLHPFHVRCRLRRQRHPGRQSFGVTTPDVSDFSLDDDHLVPTTEISMRLSAPCRISCHLRHGHAEAAVNTIVVCWFVGVTNAERGLLGAHVMRLRRRRGRAAAVWRWRRRFAQRHVDSASVLYTFLAGCSRSSGGTLDHGSISPVTMIEQGWLLTLG